MSTLETLSRFAARIRYCYPTAKPVYLNMLPVDKREQAGMCLDCILHAEEGDPHAWARLPFTVGVALANGWIAPGLAEQLLKLGPQSALPPNDL